MRILAIVILSATLFATGLLAQTAARPNFDAFEVATIKPQADDSKGRYIRMQSANRFYAKGFTLKALVAAAFSLNPQTISGGPGWTDSDRYEIVATTPGETQPNPEEQMAMLRQLLADRFHLDFRREPKELPIYALTVARTTPNLKPSDAPPESLPQLIATVFPEENGGVHVLLPARNTTSMQFAGTLQTAVLDRPVVDQTGLTGRYDFDLEWTPDENQYGGQLPRNPSPTKPSLFAALQEQLGLRLQATRGPVSALVIQRVERPSEN